MSGKRKGTDLVDKIEVYARFGIPMYLIVDPFKGECLLHTGPHGEAYETRRVTVFEEVIELPEPIGMVLETGGFRTYKRT
jgi:Uma2 family endonuclease